MSDERRPALWRRLLPWGSLALGIASALTMDRRPERAVWVALAAGAGWLALGGFALLDGLDRTRLAGRWRWLAQAAHLGASAGTQSLVQLCLFFAAPFYLRAATVPAHWAFVALLGLAAAVTLWSPLAEAILRRPPAAAALQAIATFVGLDCGLPLTGLSTRASLLAATLATAAGLPVAALAARRYRQALSALGVGAALALALLVGGAVVVPPAPLRLVEGALGTQLEERALLDPTERFAAVPEQLVCFTAIAAPRGLRDRLRHVWRQDGVVRGEAWLAIRGGRETGFRTWSLRHHLSPGRWSCSVETETGQLLGRVSADVAR